MRILTAILAWFGFGVRRRVEMPTAADHERLYGAEPEPVDIGLGMHHCKPCQRDRAATDWRMTPIPTGGKDGCATFKHGDVRLTLACGHVLTFTSDEWTGVVTEDPGEVVKWVRGQVKRRASGFAIPEGHLEIVRRTLERHGAVQVGPPIGPPIGPLPGDDPPPKTKE